MEQYKIARILSLICTIILPILMYMMVYLQNNVNELFFAEAPLLFIAMLFLIPGTIRVFIVGPPDDGYEGTHKYFAGGIFFIGLPFLFYIVAFKDALNIDLFFLFLICFFLMITCIILLILAIIFYHPPEKSIK